MRRLTFSKLFCRTSPSNSVNRSGRATRMISFTDAVRSKASMVCARTGLSPSKASNLSNPIRWLLPAATMITLSMKRQENAERRTPNAECRLQRPLVRYWAFGVGRSAFSSSQLLLHFRAQRSSIRAPRDFRLQRFHDRAHLRLRGGAHFGNRFAHERRQFVGAQSFRQIRIQDLELVLFLRRQLGPTAFFETLDRILPLFYLLADHLRGRRVVQTGIRFLDGRILQRRLQPAQDGKLPRVLGPHRVFQVGIDSFW